MDLTHLQNGSDIRGIALGGDEAGPVNLTPEAAARIGRAFARGLGRSDSEPTKVAIGMDPRLSGPALKEGLIAGISSLGHRIGDCGIASTPAMFMATLREAEGGQGYDGAIMITASHLPPSRNGFKFFTRNGGLDKEDIGEILAEASGFSSECSTPSPDPNQVRFDVMSVYAKSLRDKIRTALGSDQPLEGLHIVVDAGNGSGGFYASEVLQPLGAKTAGSLYLEPDGTFPNHIPNPEDGSAIEALEKKVGEVGADLGVIFDTDVDRGAVVDAGGERINRNRLVGLSAAMVLEEHPGTTIVTDSVTSDRLTTFIERDLGGKHHRFKRGYRNVINEARRLNEVSKGPVSYLAMETSGHAAFFENNWLDDGAYLVNKLIIKLAQLKQIDRSGTLGGHFKGYDPEDAESGEYRIRIRPQAFRDCGERVISDLNEFVASAPGWSLVKPNYEGVRVTCDSQSGNGWFVLRLSLHEPELPLNVGSDAKEGLQFIAARLVEFLKSYRELDLSSLTRSR